jgi:hypothetical protein
MRTKDRENNILSIKENNANESRFLIRNHERGNLESYAQQKYPLERRKNQDLPR